RMVSRNRLHRRELRHGSVSTPSQDSYRAKAPSEVGRSRRTRLLQRLNVKTIGKLSDSLLPATGSIGKKSLLVAAHGESEPGASACRIQLDGLAVLAGGARIIVIEIGNSGHGHLSHGRQRIQLLGFVDLPCCFVNASCPGKQDGIPKMGGRIV